MDRISDKQFAAEEEVASVQVAVRVRPFNKREIRNNTICCIRMEGKNTVLLDPASVRQEKEDINKRVFQYDFSYWSFGEKQNANGSVTFHTQEDVFRDLGEVILSNAFKGYNCSLMAYGQTGSGKSYSMMGGPEPHERGIIPRISQALFDRSAAEAARAYNEQSVELKAVGKERIRDRCSYKVEASYLEIYAERVRDLLQPSKNQKSAGGLRVREHPQTGPYVEDLTKCAVNDYKELEEVMLMGNKERTVASTNMNAESSRSHAVFTITFTQTRYDDVTNMSTDKVSKIQLVDLAGSERVDASGVTGVHLKEAANINKSLTTLGMVISALAKMSAGKAGADDDDDDEDDIVSRTRTMKPVPAAGKKPTTPANQTLRPTTGATTFVPFRNSVLTWLLKDSLGGNSKTIMIATISPSDINYDETLSTLRYAARAKKIVNKAVVNEDPNARIIRALRQEVEELRAKLAASNTDPEEVEKLREQLEQSRRIIEDINKSWEQKLEETRNMQATRMLELQSQGIAVKVDTSVPYLVNLNEDPSLSESIVYYLKPGLVYVGRSPVQDGPTSMILRGLKVKDKHCMFSNENNNVYLIPYKYEAKEFAETYVNGELLIAKRLLQHSDRIIIGQNHVFRFSSSETPAQSDARSEARMRNRLGRALSFTDLDKPATFDWDFATRERTVTQGKLQDLLPAQDKDKEHYRLLEEKLQLMQQEQEKASEVIRNQKAQYEQLLLKYREDELKRMKEEKAMPAEESELLEFQRKNKQRLTEELMKILPLVEEANAVCQALGKSSHFEVELVSHAFSAPTPAILLNRAPSIEQSNSKDDNLGGGRRGHEHSFSIRSNVSLLTPLQRLHQMKETRIQIKVTRGRGAQRGRYSLWSKDEFIDKLFLLRDMYNRISEFGQEEAANCVDPLAVNEFEPQLIGKAHIYLESLRFGVGIQQRTQILDHRGDYAGLLSVQLYCTDMELDDESSVDSEESIEPFDDEDDDEDTRSERGTRSNPQARGSILSSGSVDFDAPSPAHSAGSPLTMAALARANNSVSPRAGPLSPRRGGAVSPPPLSPHAHPLTGSASMPVGGRLRLKHEKTAGRFKLKHEVESFPPVVGERLPIILKIARADRITGLGVQNILVKYRFHNDRDTYQTDICEITSEHSMSMATFSNAVRRRRLPERLSRPVEIGYVMRHDIEPVDDKFMRFLQHDAITFEVWGSFYTGDLESKISQPTFLPGSGRVNRPMSPILSPRSSERRESFVKAIEAPSSTASNHSSTAPSPALRPNSPPPFSASSRSVTPSIGSAPVPPLPLTALKSVLAGGQPSPSVPSPGQPMSAESVLRRQVPRHAHTRSQFEGELQKEYLARKGKRTNMLYVGVDVEEMDTQGRWNPCGLKETPEEDPAAVFRISPGGERPKRFIIHVIQVDPYDFILESCASTKIDSMRIVAGGDDEEDHKRPSVASRRSSLQNPNEKDSQNELRAPINLNVWEQSYQIHNKLISITAHWPPELTAKHFVRRQTPTGERVLMSLSLQLYMSRLTSPITLNPVIAFKVYESATPVSMMRSFFRGHGPTTGRLHKLGSYFRVIKEGSEKGLESIFHEHHKQLSKLEHNMRIEQIQQHLTLIRILKAHSSAQIDEAQRGFEASVQALSKLASATMGTDLEPPGADMTPPRSGDPSVSSLKISVERAIESELRIKMGFLFKRGKFHVTWKRRWFLLRPPYLFYFKHKDDRREKGVVDLIGATVSLGQASRDPFSFEIHTATRVWYLQASSEEDMHKWVEGILEFNEFAE